MKKYKIFLLIALFGISYQDIFSQSINWASVTRQQKNIIHAGVGLEYGVVYGLGYSRLLATKMPVLLHISASIPSGEKLFDDLKTRIGGQVRLYRGGNFQWSVSLYGIYRHYQNPLVRLQNLGSEAGTVLGYYKPKWFVGAELGFDKAIVTYFKHSKIYKTTVYANVQDGWYQPATGGNVNYGIQAGFSLKRSDITLKAGRLINQNFKTTPLIPFYLQLGYHFKIGGKRG